MESSGALLVSTGSRCVTEKFLEGVVREPILERCVGCKCVTFLDAVVKAAILESCRALLVSCVVGNIFLAELVRTAVLEVTTIETKEVQVI